MTALADVVATSQAIASARSRVKKAELLGRLLAGLAPEERRCVVAWLVGESGHGKIGVGYRVLAGFSAGGGGGLSVRDVDDTFAALAALSGKGSATRRKDLLAALFARASEDEASFVRRVLVGELRQGGLEGVMVDAVARVSGVPADRVRRAWMLSGDLRAVAAAALAGEGVGAFSLRLFTPVLPMLASPTGSIAEAAAALGEAAYEYKLDGARVQVHRDGEEVRVFSRGLLELNVPKVAAAARALPASRLILDGEAIVLGADGRPRAFQETMAEFAGATPFFFDVLLVDDRELLDAPAAERFAVLQALGAPVVPRRVSASASEAEAFFRQALADGHEGIVAKALTAPYHVGARGSAWLKVKPAHTLDLVVLAVERGSGRRAGTLSNIHLGARDPAGGFVMIGKTFKGMTDAMLAWQTTRFRELEAADDGYTVTLRPEQVVEIAFDGVQRSPVYPGGVALRFARVRRYRDDKRADDADTIDTVRALSV